MAQVIEIKNEEDAWKAFFSLVDSLDKEDVKAPKIKITDWPEFRFLLRGPEYQGTFTVSSIKFANELQGAIYRSYASLKYGAHNKNVLTKEELQNLTIHFQVLEGSSNHIALIKDVILNFGKSLFEGIDGHEKYKLGMATIIGTVLIIAGQTVSSAILEDRRLARIEEASTKTVKEILESQKFADQQETIRTNKIIELAEQNVALSKILAEGYELNKSMLNAAKEAEEAEIAGNQLEQKVAKELAKNTRDTPEHKRFDGLYRVSKIADPTKDSSEFLVSIETVDESNRFTAIMDTRFVSIEVKELIFSSLKEKEEAVYLNINARVSKGKILNAYLIDGKKPEQIETAAGTR